MNVSLLSYRKSKNSAFSHDRDDRAYLLTDYLQIDYLLIKCIITPHHSSPLLLTSHYPRVSYDNQSSQNTADNDEQDPKSVVRLARGAYPRNGINTSNNANNGNNGNNSNNGNTPGTVNVTDVTASAGKTVKKVCNPFILR